MSYPEIENNLQFKADLTSPLLVGRRTYRQLKYNKFPSVGKSCLVSLILNTKTQSVQGNSKGKEQNSCCTRAQIKEIGAEFLV